MTKPDSEALYDHFASAIHERADEIVEEWIEWIIDGASIRPARMLPREAIRDHIPEVVRAVAEALRGPPEVVNEALNALKTHARLRYDQGYDIQELLKEYEGLARIIGDCLMQTLERYPEEADALDVGRVFLRLTQALAVVSDFTVGIYRAAEVEQKRELHQQLEDYIRTITHELKQPLHVIAAGAGMLAEEGASDERRQRYVEMIRRGIDRSASLIEDIRTLVLYEGAQQQQAWQLLETSVNLVLREMTRQAEANGVRIDVQDPLPKVNTNTTRVEIALVNLLSNAIKYSDADKAERWVRIEVEQAGPEEACRWEIIVRDNGLGIPKHVQPQIFERHFRAHPSVEEGTGLGLSITRRVVEQGGGSIWFESEPGEGSTFHVVIPASRAEALLGQQD